LNYTRISLYSFYIISHKSWFVKSFLKFLAFFLKKFFQNNY